MAVLLIPAFPVVGIIRGIMSVLVGPFNQGTFSHLYLSSCKVKMIGIVVEYSLSTLLYRGSFDHIRGSYFIVPEMGQGL